MNLLRPFAQLFEELKQRRHKRKFLKYEIHKAKGREFAMSEYFEGNASILELEACVATAMAFNNDDAFDDGIKQAIASMRKLQLPNVVDNNYGRVK